MAEGSNPKGGAEKRTPLDKAAFRKELTAAIPYMRAFARSLVHDDAAADDLTQDALVKAWRSRESFRAGTNFRAWVFTITRNQFYSDKRRSWRQAPWDEEHAKRTLESNENIDAILELDELRRGLDQLPTDQREALVLVGAGGFAYEEAAEICGCAVGTIKSRVNRARKALAAVVAEGPDASAGDDEVSASDAAQSILDEVRDLSGGRAPG